MPEEQFFIKLGEIPVVNDGWTTAWNCYSKVRDYNSLTKLTLGVAETGVKRAAEISTPVITRCQPQIESVNTFACKKLDELENKYPLITQPSEQVKDACVEYVQPVVGRVKPVVNYVQGVVDNSRRQVVRVKNCGTNLVVGARDLGVNSVNNAVSATFNSRPGRFVTSSADGVLTQAESLVDKYMPEHIDGENASDDGNGHDGGEEGSHAEMEEMEEMEPTPQRVVVHFKTVTNKLRRRMFQKAKKDFINAKTRTMDAVGRLHNTVDLIDYAKENFGAARDKAEDLWGQIVNESDQSNSGSVSAGMLEDRIVSLGRILTSQVRSGVSALEKATNEAGIFVRHPITKSKEYKDFMYQFSSDLMNTSVDKARASLLFIRKKIQMMIDSVESPEWLAVDIEMENIGLEEDDINSPSDDETDVPRPENHID